LSFLSVLAVDRRPKGGPSVLEDRRNDQKLWLILFQIKGIRARLNSLAIQHWLFGTLAVLICAAGLIFLSAVSLGPLAFLLAGALFVAASIIAMVRVARSSLEMRASREKAAALADERAQLKGRLMTVLTKAGASKHSALWEYLIEDTYGFRREFEAPRIEPRWVSRAIFGFLASCLLAALIAGFASINRTRHAAAQATVTAEITADIGNLDIRPADPALQPNAEIYADEATLQKLRDKLAAGGVANDKGHPLSHLMNRARNLGDTLENELTGRQPEDRSRARIKLTDRGASGDDSGKRAGAKPPGQSNGSNGAGSATPSNSSKPGNQNAQGDQQPPEDSLSENQANQMTGNLGPSGRPGSNPAQSGESNSPGASGSGSGGGANHGSGSDPENLFGQASEAPVGSDSFKITIEAAPSDETSTPGSPAYMPPRIRVPLNSSQRPDEPLARTSVPAGDQMTIKRVFER
jgi:hypothetical protein